ncbi:MAG: 3'(2'),5'-bisphosphate nucleotidase CysQ [Anaerolineales bacterium]|nr:3'(2'),5'-bisphosphate nucleotidase CysQ [Anaerolineales bacterium]MCB8952285.1 3'(2'),5'-bisphosphate nucleotidase CysQ [Ardenticatenales bacterium]
MQHLLNDVIEITRAAGAAIMGYYHSSFEVADKSPDNPVTDADFAADTLLKERLLALLPEAGWLSEETRDNPDRLNKKYVWVVDPLDGTKEFVMGIPEFSVAVALVEAGQPILSVIYSPATGELFQAAKGQGTLYNGRAAVLSPRAALAGAAIDASRSEIKKGEFEPFTDLVQLKIVGSIAYKLARVSAGICDATWSRGPKHEWDICAGSFLIEESGGRVVDLNNDPITYNKPFPKVNGIIADNGLLHNELVATLAPYGAARKEPGFVYRV